MPIKQRRKSGKAANSHQINFSQMGNARQNSSKQIDTQREADWQANRMSERKASRQAVRKKSRQKEAQVTNSL